MKRTVAYVVLILTAFLIGPIINALHVSVQVPAGSLGELAVSIDPDSPSSSPPVEWGREIYSLSCTGCHGSGRNDLGIGAGDSFQISSITPHDIYRLITFGKGVDIRKPHPAYPAALMNVERWATAMYVYAGIHDTYAAEFGDEWRRRWMANRDSSDETNSGPVLYDAYCSACHGAKGYGNGPLSGEFTIPPTNLRDTAWLARQSDMQLFLSIRNGSISGAENWSGMPYFKDFLDNHEIREIVDFLRGYGYSLASAGPRPGVIFGERETGEFPPDVNTWRWSEIAAELSDAPENPPGWLTENF